MKILLKHGRVINPATGTDEVSDLLIEDGKIVKINPEISDEADKVINADGCFIMPGLIDLHVHLREPGFEYKETIKTGAMAAARGGFTTICAMPNTNPVIDNEEVVRWIIDKADKEAVVNILPIGAITKDQQGHELADFKAMKRAGICAVSEDGKSVMDIEIYEKAMEEARKNNLPVFAHCEDKALVQGGVINKGKKSEEFRVPGISNEVEDVIVERDIRLAKETGAHLHLCHCSTKESVNLVAKGKRAGIKVTAEVCPHHFTLTEDDIKTPDSNYKMNPPVRTAEDREALIRGLKDGIIEVIATDHAPHSEEEKSRPLETAPFGIVGLETAVPLTITKLVNTGILTPLQMAEKLSFYPAKILNIDKGNLKAGSTADVTVIDPEEEYIIHPEEFVSKGKNTPFGGLKVKGKVKYTIVNGNIVFKDEEKHS